MKIVKMLSRPACDNFYGSMYYLTDDGRVFSYTFNNENDEEDDNWFEVKIPESLLNETVNVEVDEDEEIVTEELEVKYV